MTFRACTAFPAWTLFPLGGGSDDAARESAVRPHGRRNAGTSGLKPPSPPRLPLPAPGTPSRVSPSSSLLGRRGAPGARGLPPGSVRRGARGPRRGAAGGLPRRPRPLPSGASQRREGGPLLYTPGPDPRLSRPSATAPEGLVGGRDSREAPERVESRGGAPADAPRRPRARATPRGFEPPAQAQGPAAPPPPPTPALRREPAPGLGPCAAYVSPSRR